MYFQVDFLLVKVDYCCKNTIHLYHILKTSSKNGDNSFYILDLSTGYNLLPLFHDLMGNLRKLLEFDVSKFPM